MGWIAFYDLRNISTDIAIPSSLIEPFGGGPNTKTLWKVLLPDVSCARDQRVCDKSAAFFNESIIREIIRGMNLKLTIGHSNKGHKPDVILTQELHWL